MAWFHRANAPLRDWPRQRVWIIGASSGIGAELARALLARGARVALSARRREPLVALAQVGARALVLPFDVADGPGWAAAWSALRQQWGGADLVVFCAARYQPERAWEVRAATARATIETNLVSAYQCIETVLPDLMERGAGAIALVASVAGYMGLPRASVYGPTKAALINLAESLYLDLRGRGVGIYLVNPGFVRTPMTAVNTFAMPALIDPDEAALRIVAGFEAGRFEIDFPRRFTRVLRWVSRLPYAVRFPLLRRALGLR